MKVAENIGFDELPFRTLHTGYASSGYISCPPDLQKSKLPDMSSLLIETLAGVKLCSGGSIASLLDRLDQFETLL